MNAIVGLLHDAKQRICVSKITIIGPDNGLSTGRHHDII